ncbi:hypothetical protein BpHYR1_011335 [Brachionus plicatilis]|uniref:Uncharacterized protein n=1 Tax=Brachionus plicatilis TaxID=10195 RepID=A0A3M7SK76_BRAPC|nr:hypothetical protein BpHYR1_011335 [Brachionus plicatilis]
MRYFSSKKSVMIFPLSISVLNSIPSLSNDVEKEKDTVIDKTSSGPEEVNELQQSLEIISKGKGRAMKIVGNFIALYECVEGCRKRFEHLGLSFSNICNALYCTPCSLSIFSPFTRIDAQVFGVMIYGNRFIENK